MKNAKNKWFFVYGKFSLFFAAITFCECLNSWIFTNIFILLQNYCMTLFKFYYDANRPAIVVTTINRNDKDQPLWPSNADPHTITFIESLRCTNQIENIILYGCTYMHMYPPMSVRCTWCSTNLLPSTCLTSLLSVENCTAYILSESKMKSKQISPMH